eukprot:3741253-Rhodomonas_salina.1
MGSASAPRWKAVQWTRFWVQSKRRAVSVCMAGATGAVVGWGLWVLFFAHTLSPPQRPGSFSSPRLNTPAAACHAFQPPDRGKGVRDWGVGIRASALYGGGTGIFGGGTGTYGGKSAIYGTGNA